MNNQRKYNILDLFSGAGGMAEGFLQAGFDIPFASDYSKEAALTYINRHKQLGLDTDFYQGDVSKLSRGNFLKNKIGDKKIDVIIGGPPCQGFSLTGKRNPDDHRNRLFIDFLKVIKKIKPEYFVMENVLGILSFKFEEIVGLSGHKYIDTYVTDVLTQEALEFGYKISWKTLNAKDYGVPQNRIRVIFIGHKVLKKNGKIYNRNTVPNFPKKQISNISVHEAISDLNFLENGESSKIYLNDNNLTEYQKLLKFGQTPNAKNEFISATELFNHHSSKHNKNTITRFKLLKNGEKINELLKRLEEELSTEEFQKIKTKKRSCYKLQKEGLSPTILTLPDDIVHYDDNSPRILTVREFARLQSFDDSFCFYGKRTTGGDRRKLETPQYTQVGNAVPPFFARAIALEIKKALNSNLISKETKPCHKEKHFALELIQN
ncbi:DNA cytosine methyltransferase [Paenibacillus kyungheensis]